MMKLVGAFLLVFAGAGPVTAESQTPPAATPATDSSVSQIVKQLEHDWANAVMAHDTTKLDKILADDWQALAYDGELETKQTYMAKMRSGGADKIDAFEFGPMDVIVMGNVAVVTGSDTEKSMVKGKDTSGHWVWMDVYVKRDGRWLAIRGQSARMK